MIWRELEKAKVFIYLAILILPVLCRYYYAYQEYNVQLISSIVFLISFSLIIFILQAKLLIKIVRYSFLFLCFFLVYIFELTETVSFYLQGDGFNNRFFFHFNLDLIINAWSVYPLLTIFIVVILIFVALLLYQLSILPVLKSLSLYWIFPLLIVILFFNSSIHNYVKYLQIAKKLHSGSTNITKQNLDKFGLNYQAISQNKINNKKQIAAGKNLVFIYMESLEKIYQDENERKIDY